MNDKDETNKARTGRPTTQEFKDFMGSHWAAHEDVAVTRIAAAPYAAERRARLSALFPGERIVVPAGELKTRSNDTDYRFRPSSDFAYLTGLGLDHEPGAVLVFEPVADGHDVTLYLLPPAQPGDEGFYSDPAAGEFWIGRRPGLEEFAAMTGIATAALADLPEGTLEGEQPAEAVRVALAELRFVKDEYEIQQLRDAVDATIAGFEAAIAQLPRAVAHKRGERVIEASFDGHAREEGNGTGYETIAAAGPHATTLHWISNTGEVREGDLLLLDAGVEVESLYTADVTRTFPISGEYTATQRRVYEIVREAADVAFALVKPGIKFLDIHFAAVDVIEKRLTEWGIAPESVDPESKLFRRWMVHGTSHHLGIDVHDCAEAKRDLYMEGVLEPGMVFTIEPGLYFQEGDLVAPEELRGIGVRIEDDILVTADGAENLSAALPRHPDEVEAWMKRLGR
nr:aminopeptidase P family protein [Demequina soli]